MWTIAAFPADILRLMLRLMVGWPKGAFMSYSAKKAKMVRASQGLPPCWRCVRGNGQHRFCGCERTRPNDMADISTLQALPSWGVIPMHCCLHLRPISAHCSRVQQMPPVVRVWMR